MDETKTSLMNKKLDDLTVGDAVKINLAVIATTVAVPVVIWGATAAVDGVKSRLHARKARKNITVIKPEEE